MATTGSPDPNAIIEKLQAENEALRKENTALREENARLREEVSALREELEALKRAVFGRKSEKMPSAKDEARRRRSKKKKRKAAAKARARNRGSRAQLSTQTIPHQVDPKKCVCPRCGGTEFKPLGPGRKTVIYELVPVPVERHEHVQETLICTCGAAESIVTAKGPQRVFDKCRFGPALVARFLVDKAADALPWYRQERRFDRLGFPFARSTMSYLLQKSADALKPLYTRLRELIRNSRHAQADETKLQVQAPVKTRTGYVWVFLAGMFVLYWFTPRRNRKTARKLLGPGEGKKLTVDGATFYDSLCGQDVGWTRCGCLAHARRKFFDCRKNYPEVDEPLELVHQIYKIEDRAIEEEIYGTQAHLRLRQTESKPVMGAIRKWLDDHTGRHPPKSTFQKAINYAVNHWNQLIQFLDDPLVPPDNNWSENNARLVAIIRKNCLFAGSDEGAQALAVICSLVRTCINQGIDPEAYLRDVLMRIQHPPPNLDDLLPHNWAKIYAKAAEQPPVNTSNALAA